MEFARSSPDPGRFPEHTWYGDHASADPYVDGPGVIACANSNCQPCEPSQMSIDDRTFSGPLRRGRDRLRAQPSLRRTPRARSANKGRESDSLRLGALLKDDVVPDDDLLADTPGRPRSIEVQAASMRTLRAMHNEIPLGYQRRDGQMATWALTNSVSREDMAIASGLAKSRVDQIIRENYLASGLGKGSALLLANDDGPDAS
jgi:hypothetical protein